MNEEVVKPSWIPREVFSNSPLKPRPFHYSTPRSSRDALRTR